MTTLLRNINDTHFPLIAFDQKSIVVLVSAPNGVALAFHYSHHVGHGYTSIYEDLRFYCMMNGTETNEKLHWNKTPTKTLRAIPRREMYGPNLHESKIEEKRNLLAHHLCDRLLDD